MLGQSLRRAVLGVLVAGAWVQGGLEIGPCGLSRGSLRGDQEQPALVLNFCPESFWGGQLEGDKLLLPI